MKKYIMTICLLVSACASPQYNFRSSAAISEGKNQTIKVVSPDKTVASTKLKTFFENKLKENGFKVVSSEKKSRYGFVYGITSKSWQSMETQAIWGPTAINSINTQTSGYLYGDAYTNYNFYSPYSASADTDFNASYNGISNTDINYDYGITGYQNVIVNNFQINFTSLMLDYKTQEVVYEGHLVGTEPVDNDAFADYVMDIYSKQPMFMNNNIVFTCKSQNTQRICLHK